MLLLDLLFWLSLRFPLMESSVCSCLPHIITLELSIERAVFFYLRAPYATHSQFSILCVARLTKEENEQHKLCDIGCKFSKRSTRYICICIISNSNINGWTYRPRNAFDLLVFAIYNSSGAYSTHEEQFSLNCSSLTQFASALPLFTIFHYDDNDLQSIFDIFVMYSSVFATNDSISFDLHFFVFCCVKRISDLFISMIISLAIFLYKILFIALSKCSFFAEVIWTSNHFGIPLSVFSISVSQWNKNWKL